MLLAKQQGAPQSATKDVNVALAGIGLEISNMVEVESDLMFDFAYEGCAPGDAENIFLVGEAWTQFSDEALTAILAWLTEWKK